MQEVIKVVLGLVFSFSLTTRLACFM